MKTLIISCLAAAAIVSLSACTTVKEAPEPSTHTLTTTTETSSMHSPANATSTTETHNVRSY
jgi:uncharacterized lipoprotein